MEKYITLTGQVSIEKYREVMSECDVVVNPCLKEGGVTTAFDALSFNKPLICIDTGGYTKYFDEDYAIVISRNSREQIIDDLFKAVVRLSDDSIRKKMSFSTTKGKECFTWENKGLEIKTLLNSVVKNK
jgi:glycosyltransferase involved in cell wall biosynthesis